MTSPEPRRTSKLPSPPPMRGATPYTAPLVRQTNSKPFICPFCVFANLCLPSRSSPQPRRPRRPDLRIRRHAATATPATRINAPVDVPTRFKELYEALTSLKSDAGIYVGLSRLQLALRGLEGGNPVTRIASVLSIPKIFRLQYTLFLLLSSTEQRCSTIGQETCAIACCGSAEPSCRMGEEFGI